MQRSERKSIHDLLRAAHADRKTARLGSGWRNGVMADISRLESGTRPLSDWERIAPRFTIAAAALSVILLMTATVGLGALPDEIISAYADQFVNVVPATLSDL